jgi:hypothetical protein
MANTFELIASSTVGSGGASTISFTSIPNTYKDLQLFISARDTNSSVYAGIDISFNGSSTGYSERMLYTVMPSVLTAGGTGNPVIYWSGYSNGSTTTSNTFSNFSIYIPNYASSSNKFLSSDGVVENNSSSNSSVLLNMNAALWANTAAINSILLDASTSFVQYTTAYLYGIKNS